MHALIIEIANTCSADCGRSPKPQISNGALTCTKALLLHYVFFFMCFPFFLTFCSCSPEQPGYNPSRFGAKQKTRITTANCFHDLGMPPLEKASRKAPPNKLGLPSLPLQGRRNTKRDKDTNLPRIFGVLTVPQTRAIECGLLFVLPNSNSRKACKVETTLRPWKLEAHGITQRLQMPRAPNSFAKNTTAEAVGPDVPWDQSCDCSVLAALRRSTAGGCSDLCNTCRVQMRRFQYVSWLNRSLQTSGEQQTSFSSSGWA